MQKQWIAITCIALLMPACGGSDTPDTLAGASASVSATTSTLNAAGSWKVTGQTCQGFPVVATIPAAIRSTENAVQTFEGCANLDYVACSEGTLDTTSGAMVLCYGDTLSTCVIRCIGTYITGAPVTLICNDLPSGICNITVQKE